MKKIVLLGAMFLLLIIGYRFWYPAIFFEFKSVLKVPNKENRIIKIGDSLILDPMLSIESPTTFCAGLRFENILDSVYIDSLNIEVKSMEMPSQIIELTHVLTYKDIVIEEDINASYIRVQHFDDLSDHHKTIDLKRKWNIYIFYFKTNGVEQSKNYKFVICGLCTYQNQKINFKKEITAQIIKEYVPIQIMH